jgi:alpha-ketoglutarate-dependent taurine dioxygenase
MFAKNESMILLTEREISMAETTALSPNLGVQVSDVENLLDEVVIAQCLEALKWRGVLLIRGVNLDDEQQVAFSRRIGEVVSQRDQEIFKVSLDPTVNPLSEVLKGTFNWHIDGTYDQVPQKATTLTARHVAMVGGQTAFASTYAAYENLPEGERKRIDTLRVVHSFEAAQRRVFPSPSEKEVAGWRRVPTNEVSLVWRRRDGRRSMVLGATADHIVGMDPDESRALLAELEEWTTQERFRYTHEWREGDLVVWDNTGMLHRALPYEASSHRILHRTTMHGVEAFS